MPRIGILKHIFPLSTGTYTRNPHRESPVLEPQIACLSPTDAPLAWAPTPRDYRDALRTHLGLTSAAKASATGRLLGRGPSEAGLVDTRRCDGGWVDGELEMAQYLTDDRCLIDGGDEAQPSLLTHRTGCHIEGKYPLQQPCPVPSRRGTTGVVPIAALLAQGGKHRTSQVTMRRQHASIAHLVNARWRDQCRELFELGLNDYSLITSGSA